MTRNFRAVATLAFLLGSSAAALGAPSPYGSKGIYPVYESAGQWLIFDKNPGPAQSALLKIPEKYLVIGSQGSGVFWIARDSMTYGGACQKDKPVALRAALLKGPRSLVGRPIIGIHVGPDFSLKGSRAVFQALSSSVSDQFYQNLDPALSAQTIEEIKEGLVPVDFSTNVFDERQTYAGPRPDIETVIDFAASIPIKGLTQPSALVTQSTVSKQTWRCLREADGSRLAGACALMPHELMAETGLLQFVSYDPSGSGQPFLFAFTRRTPQWGDERWGFILGPDGPRIFLMDTMDIRCRASL